VADLVRATGYSRSKAYKLLARGVLPFQVFAVTRFIRSGVVDGFLTTTKNSWGIPS
jgi:hypothetical protein